MASIELSESVYIIYLMSLFFLSLTLLFLLLSFQLCGWMLPLVVPLFWWCLQILLQSLLSFLSSLILQCGLPCYYSAFLCFVRSAVFSHHFTCVFLHQNRILCRLPTTGLAVYSSSLLSPVFSYVFDPIFLGALP